VPASSRLEIGAVHPARPARRPMARTLRDQVAQFAGNADLELLWGQFDYFGNVLSEASPRLSSSRTPAARLGIRAR
jgi:hypothetical protein